MLSNAVLKEEFKDLLDWRLRIYQKHFPMKL